CLLCSCHGIFVLSRNYIKFVTSKIKVTKKIFIIGLPIVATVPHQTEKGYITKPSQLKAIVFKIEVVAVFKF
ncbi:hypothetical protein, partial [Calothrix rhizosoleniae]|uniref:hypothetical protein n=1 Tax=Calothrix rhizosoleniae TaxID=888997 RepID=UPI001F2F3855